MRRTFMRVAAALMLIFFLAGTAAALVNYEAGQLEVNGMLLLQDYKDEKAYYYLPPSPGVSMQEEMPELSVVKFVDPRGETSGGIFHMLVTFSLPPEEQADLARALENAKPGAKLLGPVPLHQGEEGSFNIISASLTDKGFTQNVITSGKAPLTPGSKAAVAACLTPQGATLLWESLTRPTSDVSVALSAYYEAALPSFEAKIHADISTVYTHFSSIFNRQEEYTRRQIRDIMDELVRSGTVNIEIMDRMPGDAKIQAMQSLVDLASAKLTEIIFDQKTGFTALPEKEKVLEKGQLKGRQKKGWLARLFTSTGNQKYFTDNQFVLKKRSDINRAVFSINLNRRSVVKVPVDTAGNISGLYQAFGEDPAVFRVVNLADPAFQKREVYFRLDGRFTKAFEKIMNFAGVSLRKQYERHADDTGELLFTREDIRNGALNKSWRYARLGEQNEDWLSYAYRVTWSIQGRHQIRQPEEKDEWLQSADPIVTLAPPLERMDLEIDADRFLFEDARIRSATLEVAYKVFGSKETERLAVMRVTDAESVQSEVLFHDPGTEIHYRVNWYPSARKAVFGEWRALNGSYLVLMPPESGN